MNGFMTFLASLEAWDKGKNSSLALHSSGSTWLRLSFFLLGISLPNDSAAGPHTV